MAIIRGLSREPQVSERCAYQIRHTATTHFRLVTWCGARRQWHCLHLSEANRQVLWIPAGFAHGFRVLSEGAHVLYEATGFYYPEAGRTIEWDDPVLNIDWQLTGPPIVSGKDSLGRGFAKAAMLRTMFTRIFEGDPHD